MLRRTLPRSLSRPMCLLMTMACFCSVALVIAVPLPAGSRHPIPSRTIHGELKIGHILWEEHCDSEDLKYKWVQRTEDLSATTEMLCYSHWWTCFGYNKHTGKVEKVSSMKKNKEQPDSKFYSSLDAVVLRSSMTDQARDATFEMFARLTKDDIQKEFPNDQSTPEAQKYVHVMLRRGPVIILSGYNAHRSLQQNMRASSAFRWWKIRIAYLDPDSEEFQIIIDQRTGELVLDGKEPNCICPQLLERYCYCLMASDSSTKELAIREIPSHRLDTRSPECEWYHPVVVPMLNGKAATHMYANQQLALEQQIKNDLTNIEDLKLSTGSQIDSFSSYLGHALFPHLVMKEFLTNFDRAAFEEKPITSLITSLQVESNARATKKSRAGGRRLSPGDGGSSTKKAKKVKETS
ncbi:hypothetical protein FB446DRAFT_97325 [Lentinula raphanica]|nr:hypothetical protein FB446DRAFT_97325 [Lentinula raphanica]